MVRVTPRRLEAGLSEDQDRQPGHYSRASEPVAFRAEGRLDTDVPVFGCLAAAFADVSGARLTRPAVRVTVNSPIASASSLSLA
jgi:hypothetical protein